MREWILRWRDYWLNSLWPLTFKFDLGIDLVPDKSSSRVQPIRDPSRFGQHCFFWIFPVYKILVQVECGEGTVDITEWTFWCHGAFSKSSCNFRSFIRTKNWYYVVLHLSDFKKHLSTTWQTKRAVPPSARLCQVQFSDWEQFDNAKRTSFHRSSIRNPNHNFRLLLWCEIIPGTYPKFPKSAFSRGEFLLSDIPTAAFTRPKTTQRWIFVRFSTFWIPFVHFLNDKNEIK